MGFDLLSSVPHSYTLERHLDQDGVPLPGSPKWLLRSLPSRLMLSLTRLAGDDPDIGIAAVVEAGLVGFEGITRDGEIVKFEAAGTRHIHGIEVTGGVKAEILDLIHVRIISELGHQLMRINTLDIESAKN